MCSNSCTDLCSDMRTNAITLTKTSRLPNWAHEPRKNHARTTQEPRTNHASIKLSVRKNNLGQKACAIQKLQSIQDE